MKTIVIMLMILVFMLTMIVVTADEPEQSYVEQQIVQEMKASLNDDYHTSFMDGCLENGNRVYCECTWDYLRQTHTPDEIGQMGLDILDGAAFPSVFWEAVDACLELYEN